MHTPAPRLRVAVDHESGNRIELVADVEAERADRRLVAEAGADRVPQVVELQAPAVRPDVARVEEEHGAEAAADARARFGAVLEHAVAANRQARIAERAELVAAPPAHARRASEEELARERHRR